MVFLSKLTSKIYVPFPHRKVKASHYLIIKNLLRPGDIILTKTNGYLSNIFIGKWTHAGMYSGYDSVIEATTERGVQEKHLIDFLLTKDRIKVIRPVGVSGQHITLAIRRAKLHIGKPYDFKFQPNVNAFYCSELLLHALQMDSIKTVKRYGSETFIPDDFLTYKKEFEGIYET